MPGGDRRRVLRVGADGVVRQVAVETGEVVPRDPFDGWTVSARELAFDPVPERDILAPTPTTDEMRALPGVSQPTNEELLATEHPVVAGVRERFEPAPAEEGITQAAVRGRGSSTAPETADPAEAEGKPSGTPEVPLAQQSLEATQGRRFKGMHEMGATRREVQEQVATILDESKEVALMDDAIAVAQRELEEQERRIEEIDTSIQNLMETPFDANRLFNGADGATRFSAIFGRAVGHMLQTVQSIVAPGSNPANVAAAMIDQAIERDVQEQARNFNRGLQGLAAQRSALGVARQAGLDRQQAMEYARMRERRHVSQRLQVLAQRYQGTQFEQRLNALADQYAEQVQTQYASMRAALLAQEGNRGTARTPFRDPPPLSWRFNSEEARAVYDFRKSDPFWRPRLQAAVEMTESGTALLRNLRVADAMTRQEGITNQALRAQLETISSLITVDFSEASRLGALGEDVLSLMERIQGDSTATLQTRNMARAKIRTFMQTIEARMRDVAGQHHAVFDVRARPNLGEPELRGGGPALPGSIEAGEDIIRDEAGIPQQGGVPSE